jgi:spore germination cell wall hydrolase CwlJ-like protein
MRVAALSEAIRPPARTAEPAADAAKAAAKDGKTAPVRLDVASIEAMPHVAGDAEWQCLAQAIYFESRGEPLDGQIAVAEVVLNRVADRRFPKTVCGVTNQGCQFSYTCDGHSDVMKSAGSRQRSEKIATLMLSGHPRTLTDGATYFHTRSVRPNWSRKFTRTTTIGHHMFYRPATQVAGG